MRRDGRDEDGVSIDGVKALRATAKALLVQIPADEPRELWIPQSVITDDSEVFAAGDEGTLVVRSWFAEREGLDT